MLTVRTQILILDRLSWLAVGIGATMAASGAFTLAFQASGIGYIGQSVLALAVGTTLTATGFNLAGRARTAQVHLYARPQPTLRRPALPAWQSELRLPVMRVIPPAR